VQDVPVAVVYVILLVPRLLVRIKDARPHQNALHRPHGLLVQVDVRWNGATQGQSVFGVRVGVAVVLVQPRTLEVAIVQVCTDNVNIGVIADEIQLADGVLDAQAFGDVTDDVLGVSVRDFARLAYQRSVLQVLASDFLNNEAEQLVLSGL